MDEYCGNHWDKLDKALTNFIHTSVGSIPLFTSSTAEAGHAVTLVGINTVSTTRLSTVDAIGTCVTVCKKVSWIYLHKYKQHNATYMNQNSYDVSIWLT